MGNATIENGTTLAGYCAGAGITLKHGGEDYNYSAPKWALEKGIKHYRVTLRYKRRQFSLWWYQGSAIKNDPEVQDILENLLTDYSMADYSLDDYITDLGYEVKSIQDYRDLVTLRRTVIRHAKALERLIGNPDLLNALLDALNA